MKISKVNNVRTAVALKNREGKTGLLYKYPSREQNRNELQDQIKKQVKSGKYLYCVFNTTQGKRTAEVCLAGELNRQFPKDISIISEKELYKKITDFFARSHSYSDEMIRRTVDQHLRKTLYRTAGEDLKTLLLAGQARKSYTALSK